MVGNVTIQGQITGTATFDGAKISAVVTVSPPINATVIFGKSGVTVHNELTGRDAENTHPKESITDLTITDSPEFANTQITTLKDVTSGGIIPDAEATWLGATAKSVLSYLQKLVSKVYAINSRVVVLEDNYLLKYIVPADVLTIDITKDRYGNDLNIVEGDSIEIICIAKQFNDGLSNRFNIRINKTGVLYRYGNAASTTLLTSGTNYLNLYSTTKITLLSGEVQGYVIYQCKVSTAPTFASATFAYYSEGLAAENINKITIISDASPRPIPAGSIILIRKA